MLHPVERISTLWSSGCSFMLIYARGWVWFLLWVLVKRGLRNPYTWGGGFDLGWMPHTPIAPPCPVENSRASKRCWELKHRSRKSTKQSWPENRWNKLLTLLQGSTSYKVQNRMLNKRPSHPCNSFASERCLAPGRLSTDSHGRTWVLGTQGPLLPDLPAKVDWANSKCAGD